MYLQREQANLRPAKKPKMSLNVDCDNIILIKIIIKYAFGDYIFTNPNYFKRPVALFLKIIRSILQMVILNKSASTTSLLRKSSNNLTY